MLKRSVLDMLYLVSHMLDYMISRIYPKYLLGPVGWTKTRFHKKTHVSSHAGAVNGRAKIISNNQSTMFIKCWSRLYFTCVK